MVVVLMMEWELPKDEHRMKKLLDVSQRWHDYFIKLSKEKMIKTNYVRVCTDDAGHFVEWWELESLAEFQKVWDDEGS